MGTMASQITSLTIVYPTVIQAQIKENIKAPRHWPLCGEVTGTGEFPAQRVSNTENVSIWWRHHYIEWKDTFVWATRLPTRSETVIGEPTATAFLIAKVVMMATLEGLTLLDTTIATTSVRILSIIVGIIYCGLLIYYSWVFRLSRLMCVLNVLYGWQSKTYQVNQAIDWTEIIELWGILLI